MKELLQEKLKAYKNSYFENKEFQAWLKDSDLWVAAYTCLRLRGIEMGKKDLVDVLEGKLMEDLPLDIYGFAHAFRDLFKDMKACLQMQQSLDSKLINRFYKILFDGEGYRRDNPVVFEWNFVPPHFNSVESEIDMLCKDIDKEPDPIERAINIHLGLDGIYPYGKETAVMALVAMYYELMKDGVPLPSFTVDDEDYNKIIKQYLANGVDEFTDMFARSEINRLEQVMMFGIESQER